MSSAQAESPMLPRIQNRYATEVNLLWAMGITFYGLLMVTTSDSQWPTSIYSYTFDVMPRQAWGVLWLCVAACSWTSLFVTTFTAQVVRTISFAGLALVWAFFIWLAVLDKKAPVGGPVIWVLIGLQNVVSLRAYLGLRSENAPQ